MDATIKPLNKKVSMFASNDELYEKLTNKEITTIKLAKLDEYVQDLLHLTEKTNGELSMVASSKYNTIKEILAELNNLNC
ncbi:MAG: hypothetical protein CL833_07355 [Crocinitomicaceae bacterium]|nr:hypothetical protein [Crocinitomicaceae bacterium]